MELNNINLITCFKTLLNNILFSVPYIWVSVTVFLAKHYSDL